ncbi:MAG TPA: metal-dependent hydrolase [Polyangiaceae bacterium]|jgi:inner membrane protein|nr:metal-dependent hydrolase [Polyangiaceae bacterium]
MDNVTHSLAAVLLAEAMCDARAPSPEASRFRTAALWTSLLANNFPDFDFVYRGITPGKLGYLLHHRGHTHTVIGALVLSGVSLLVVYAVARMRAVRFDARDWRALGLLAVVGTLLHITFDLQNNYGVHPFWPFDDRWYYGDFLFIVEPLLLAVAIPTIALLAETRVAKLAVTALFAAALVFGAVARAVPPAEIVGLVFVAVLVALAARALSRRGRIRLGIGGWAVVTLAFFVASHSVDRLVRTASAARFPATKLVDVVRTPTPGNILCWSIITLGVEGDRYVARRGLVSLAPGVFTPARCGSHDSRTATAPLAGLEVGDEHVLFRSEFSGKLAELRALRASNCGVAAFLRWSRAPFWLSGEPVIGDLRFDRSRAMEFAEMTTNSAACPPNLPPWTAPRTDVLGP